MAAITDYTSLITSEHQNAARFVATVQATVSPMVDLINCIAGLPGNYDLDQAMGTQLDAIGLWVGVARNVAISVDQYFAFDTASVGFDQGVWFQVGDSLSTVTMLDDGHYRSLIRAKIACNSWDGSLPAAYQILLALVSPEGGRVSVTEGTMSVAWTIHGTISVVTQAILTGGYVPLKPINGAVSYTFSTT
jgi:hypothetical protein